MAIKGLSIPVFGKYNNNAGVVTYTDGVINPHAVSYTLSPESSDNNPLYADNRIVENDTRKFSTGTLSLELDDLDNEITKFVLGAKEVERTYGEGKTVKSIVFDDDAKAPTLGVGLIVLHQRNDIDVYVAVIVKKCIFGHPEDAATTKGDSVDWQTSSIEGTFTRSEEYGENGKYPWKEQAEFASESEALEFLEAMLGVTKGAGA